MTLELARPRPLERSLSAFAVLLLALSAATPASSAFVILPDVLKEAGTGALLSLGLAALIGALVAETYAELASAFPHAGGEYAMVGRTLGQGAGFVVLALNGINSVLTGAALSLGATQYFSALWPGLEPVPTALAIAVAATVVGVLKLRSGAAVTGLFLAVEVVALLFVAGLGVIHPERGAGELLAHPVKLAGSSLGAAPVGSVLLATTMALFAYDGYGAAVYFAEELKEAARRIGPVVLSAFAVVVVLEIAAATGTLTGAADLKDLFGADSMLSQFVQSRAGPTVARVLSLAVGLAIVNAVIAMVLLTARQLYATGRDGLWPGRANAAMTALRRDGGAPWAATLAAGGATAALCFIPLKMLLVLTGTGLTFVYASLALALLAGRRRGSTSHGLHRAPAGQAMAVILVLALAGVIAANGMDPDTGRPSLIFTVGLAVVAALYYRFVLKPRGGWVLRGPED